MKFYFAWCHENEQFDPTVHARRDEHLFSLEISGQEAKYPTAYVQIMNPKCGLINHDRQQWAFISGDRGEGVELMFRGRILAIPEKIEGETLKILLIAEPTESKRILMDLHHTLKTAPFWDPLFIQEEEQDNPFESMEARAALYYWSRTTSKVTLSDYFWGQEKLVLKGNFFRDSLKISRTATPLAAVDVTLTADWNQRYEGRTDISRLLHAKFPEGLINTLTGQSLEKRWWRCGEKIGRSGYWIAHSELREVQPKYTGALDLYPARSKPFWMSPYDPLNETKKPQMKRLKRSWYRAKLVLGWLYRQRRRENLHFKLEQKTQIVAYEAPRTRKLHLYLQNLMLAEDLHPWKPDWVYSRGYRVEEKEMVYQCIRSHHSRFSFAEDQADWRLLGRKPNIPLEKRRGSFFLTDRGRQAFEHALEVARAHLAATARAMTLRIEAPLEVLWDISCDHTIEVEDSRLPGGKAQGKVISYCLKVEGQTGRRWAEVSIGVAVGDQDQQSLPYQKSSLCYVEEDYIKVGTYQFESNTWRESPSGFIYEDWGDQIPQRGHLYPDTLHAKDIIEDIVVRNGAEEQNQVLQDTQYPRRHHIKSVLKEVATDIRIILADLQSLGMLTHDVHVKIPMAWSAPQQIDLAAAPLVGHER
ncbi:hypothetical protein IM40_06995 [Candidatus Paracaedimonas acanthamoebae]|nr:hypothetical protein IM40_06995 [Candidatus Paracaedimonas acanthamoebae]